MSIHNIPFLNMKKKITLNYPKSAAMGFFLRVRNNRGKRAISVRATDGLLYFFLLSSVVDGTVHKQSIFHSREAYRLMRNKLFS